MQAITQEYLKSILQYYPISGLFIWLNGKNKGQIAGSYDKYGYAIIKINKKLYFAHRLAFVYMIGKWPKNITDHKDGNPANNKWENLREATNLENVYNSATGRNNTSGYKGVHWHKGKQKWAATMRVDGRKLHLGLFDDPKEAYSAYCAAAEMVQGEFARLNDCGPKTGFRD